jgi:hypothetical protein
MDGWMDDDVGVDVVGFPAGLPGSIAERDDTLVHERADDGACDRDRDLEYQEKKFSRRQMMGYGPRWYRR